MKQLPLSIEKRLSQLSSNEKVVNSSVPIHQEELRKTGNNHKLKYQKQSFIDKHLLPHHKIHKLFNRNNVNISYNSLPNMKSMIVNSRNSKIYTHHQLLVIEFTTTSTNCYFPSANIVAAVTFCTKRTLPH